MHQHWKVIAVTQTCHVADTLDVAEQNIRELQIWLYRTIDLTKCQLVSESDCVSGYILEI